MRLTIVPDDSMAIVDGVPHVVDCSSVDADIHAVQWDDVSGHIEFKTVNGERSPNQMITDMAQFAVVVDLWNIEDAKPKRDPTVSASDAQAKTNNRRDVFGADLDRQGLVNMLSTMSPEEIRGYVDQTVTDIDSTRKLLGTLLVSIAHSV